MEIKASAKYLRISPRKLRLLTRGLVGLPADRVLVKIQAYPAQGRLFLEKVIKQGVANAKNNFKLSEGNLRLERIEVGEGPAFKRMDKSHGARFDRGMIKKRTAHLFVTLSAQEPKAEPVKTAPAKPTVVVKEESPKKTVRKDKVSVVKEKEVK